MRFHVNELIFAVHFGTYTLGSNEGKLCPWFYPWYTAPLLHSDTPPDDINLTQLEVTEHHRVPTDYDVKGECDCDGYLLKDPKGVVFVNQYPYASYGQMSDEGNRRFRRHITQSGETKTLREENPKVIFEYHLLSDVLENIERGIKELAELVLTLPEDIARAKAKRDQLVEFKKRLIKAFHAQYPDYKINMGWVPAMKGSDLLWPKVTFDMIVPASKFQAMKKEEVVKIFNSCGHIEAKFKSKNRMAIVRTEGEYYLNRKTTEVKSINVMFLEYSTDPTENGKPGFNVCNSDLFPQDWVETAIDCFLTRVNADSEGFKATNTGMRLEEIAARDKKPEGIAQVKQAETLGDLVREKLRKGRQS